MRFIDKLIKQAEELKNNLEIYKKISDEKDKKIVDSVKHLEGKN